MSSKKYMKGSEPFFFQGGEYACLLIHGFTATPYEVRYLGEKLSEAGFTVLAPRLPGHGCRVQDLDKTRWRDWYTTVQEFYEFLEAQYTEVFLVGMSAGGTLGLYLMSKGHRPLGAAILAAPVKLHTRMVNFVYALFTYLPGLTFLPALKKKRGPDISDLETQKELVTYSHSPIRAGMEMLKFMAKTKRRLDKVTSPLLLMQSKNDHVVPIDNPDIILQGVSSELTRMVWLENSYHIITWDVEKDVVAQHVIDFFNGLLELKSESKKNAMMLI